MNPTAPDRTFRRPALPRAALASVFTAALLAACGGGGGGGGSGGGGPGGCDPNGYGGGCPMAGYTVHQLVSDQAGLAHQDPNLVNGWGVAFNPSGYVWVANNGTGTSTLYDGNGVPQSLVVTLPAGVAGAATPTGIVYNGSGDFVVSDGTNSGAAAFIFVGENGTVSAWSPAVSLPDAFNVVDNGVSTGAVYKGVALAATGGSHRLYAADFHNHRVDVFDATFAPMAVAGGFVDATLPSGYAPFNVQEIGGQIYVAYAMTTPGSDDETAGAGLGMVNVFDVDGNLVSHLIPAGGALNAPWGMAMAPAAGFGAFSGDLLVGNFGNGWIEAYGGTGNHAGTLSDSNGNALHLDGLWGIAFGNGLNAQPTTTLFYAAGPSDEAHGVYGSLTAR